MLEPFVVQRPGPHLLLVRASKGVTWFQVWLYLRFVAIWYGFFYITPDAQPDFKEEQGHVDLLVPPAVRSAGDRSRCSHRPGRERIRTMAMSRPASEVFATHVEIRTCFDMDGNPSSGSSRSGRSANRGPTRNRSDS